MTAVNGYSEQGLPHLPRRGSRRERHAHSRRQYGDSADFAAVKSVDGDIRRQATAGAFDILTISGNGDGNASDKTQTVRADRDRLRYRISPGQIPATRRSQ